MRKQFYQKVNDALTAIGVTWPGGAENMVVNRTRAGYWQKAAGALSWFLTTTDYRLPFVKDVGGFLPASSYKGRIKAFEDTHLIWIEIVPEGETQ